MDAVSFDRITRTLAGTTRRGLLRGVPAALGIAAAGIPSMAEARKRKKKRKKKKATFNAFGCVDVGNFCNDADQCCSGVCTGKKGKKTCKAHDQATCQAGQTIEECGGAVEVPCTATGGEEGLCVTTTGKAGFCLISGNCFPCKKDVDCEPSCGLGAACAVCTDNCEDDGGTACVGLGACR